MPLRILFLLVLLNTAFADSPPPRPPPNTSAGIIDREIEDQYALDPFSQERHIPVIELEHEEELDLDCDTEISVKHITFIGNEVFSTETLEKVAARHLSDSMTMCEIQEICREIQRMYVEKGYLLARVYPPRQKMTDGTLILQVREGILGEVTVIGNHHYSARFLAGHLNSSKGKPIHYPTLLRALLILNEYPDLRVGAIFQKGNQLGTADIVLRVEESSPWHSYLDTNNYGSHQTTRYRAGAKLQKSSLLHSGDLFTVSQVMGIPPAHLEFTNGTYQIPLNRIGTNLSLSFLYSFFSVASLNSLDLHGNSLVGGAKITHALTRTRRLSVDIRLGFDYKNLKNYALDAISSYDRLRVATFGFDIEYDDALQGRNFFDVDIAVGIPDLLGGLKSIDPQCSRVGSGGRYVIMHGTARRMQPLPKDSFLILNAVGQWGLYKVPLPEQVYIGGYGIVRGYPLAGAMGDTGMYGNAEFRIAAPWESKMPLLRSSWKESVQFVFFVDQGLVTLSGQKQTGEPGFISMTSGGLGIRIYQQQANLEFSADVGFPFYESGKSTWGEVYLRLNWLPF